MNLWTPPLRALATLLARYRLMGRLRLTLGAALAIAALSGVSAGHAASLTTLVIFHGSNGAVPNGLIADAAGNLYGTTDNGGAGRYGTVFQLTPSGTLNVLYSFTGGNDGGFPVSGLIADAAGSL